MNKRKLLLILPIVLLLSIFLVIADPYGWSLTSVLTADDVGTYASIAINSSDDVHIAYNDATNRDLEHAWYDAEAETWHTESVASAWWPGLWTSIAVNSTDAIHIMYHEESDKALLHAWYDEASDKVWHTETVDSDGGITTIGYYTDVAINSTDDIHVSYQNNTNNELLHAWYDTEAGTWHTESVDDGGGVTTTGLYTSIAINSTDDVHISYHNDTDDELMHAWYDTEAGSWHIETADDGGGGADDVGEYTSIVINSTDDVHIVYQNETATSLEYIWYDTTAGTWHQKTVDATAVVGQYASAAINSTDDIHVSYFDWTSDMLKHAWKDNSVGTWVLETVDNPASFVGLWTGIAIDSMNRVHIGYYDTTDGDLEYASWDDTPPEISNPSPENNSVLADAMAAAALNVSIETDEDASCRLAAALADLDYTEMTPFDNTDARVHYTSVDIAVGGTYDYYIKCNDSRANINPTDYQLSFSVEDVVEEEEVEEDSSSGGASVAVVASNTVERAITEAVPAVFGETISVAEGHAVSFSVGSSSHSVFVGDVGETSVTFEVHSEPQKIVVNIGETKQVDADLNGTPDVKLNLISVNVKAKTAEFTLSEIKGGITEGELVKDNTGLIATILVIVGIVGVGLGWFYFRKNKA